MNPRLAVVLPVLPALAHAATLRWAAADLDDRYRNAAFADVSDGLRYLSVGLAGFVVVLVLVALLTPGLVRLIGSFLLYASLPLQFLLLAMNLFILWADRTDEDSLGETTLSIALAQLGTELLFLAASIVAVIVLRRPRAGRSGGTAAPGDRAPTSSTSPASRS
jgi:hypothetical protein